MKSEWKRQEKFEKGNIEKVYFCDVDKNTRLGHVVQYNGFGHWFSVYCVGKPDGKPLTSIEPMVNGKIAPSPILDHRDSCYEEISLMEDEKRAKLLVGIYDLVGDYIPTFEKGPSTSPSEIRTLKGIEERIERLRKGKSTYEDMELFWVDGERD